MDKVRAYYKPGEGYLIYMPDGSPIPYIKNISIHDNWLESSSRVGTTRVQSIATADVSLNVDVVNEPPVINPDLTDIDKIQAYINVNNDCNPSFKAGNISDGYHTFDELYAHRIALFKALCRSFFSGEWRPEWFPWKSLKHSDGSKIDGWFIAGIGKEPGKQVTYHLPLSEFDNLCAETLEVAPEWDGHTSADVLKRLSEL